MERIVYQSKNITVFLIDPNLAVIRQPGRTDISITTDTNQAETLAIAMFTPGAAKLTLRECEVAILAEDTCPGYMIKDAA